MRDEAEMVMACREVRRSNVKDEAEMVRACRE